jgi:hypothetical protein
MRTTGYAAPGYKFDRAALATQIKEALDGLRVEVEKSVSYSMH